MDSSASLISKREYSFLKRDLRNDHIFDHVIVALVFIVAVFAYSTELIDKYSTAKYYFTQLFVLMSIFIFSIKIAFKKNIVINDLAISVAITVICSVEAIYSIFQWIPLFSFENLYPVTGYFDNPAGLIACLCAGLPFALYVREKYMGCRFLSAVCIVVIFSAIILSSSRTGIIVAMGIIVNSILDIYHIKRCKWVTIFIIIISFVVIGYYIRPQSADGRMLIWRSALNMAADAPLVGYGLNGFSKLYMDYQASFLSNINNEAYNILADNTIFPFNEYLNLYICFGVPGYILLVTIIVFIGFAYKRSISKEKKAALSSLLCIGFISLFSYPFKYPFTYLICIFNIYLIVKNLVKIRINSGVRLLFLSVAISCIPLSYIVVNKLDGEYRWKQAYNCKDMEQYKLLLPLFEDNPSFLYNYSVELYQNQQIDKSLEIALLCRNMLASYDLELLLGDIYFRKREYNLSEKYYIQASKMCPCRFMPLNQLYDLYKSMGIDERALEIAIEIVNKPIKVKSRTITQIRYKMLHALEHELDVNRKFKKVVPMKN